MTDSALPPPSRGQRVTSPRCGLGTNASWVGLSRVRRGKLPTGAEVLVTGRCHASTVPSRQGIVSASTRSRRRPTTLLLIRGHRDDQLHYRSGPDCRWPWSWFRFAPVPQQDYALPPGAHQVHAGSLQDPALRPGTLEVRPLPAGSQQVRPHPQCTPGPGQGRPAVLSDSRRARWAAARRPVWSVDRGDGSYGSRRRFSLARNASRRGRAGQGRGRHESAWLAWILLQWSYSTCN